MKNRPEPKKISYIKVNNTKNNNNKNKKQNNVLINNLIIINSPKTKNIASSNKISEKLFNKIKQYSLEANLLNQHKTPNYQNINKNIIKYNPDNSNNNNLNDLTSNKNNKKDDLRFNSLDTKNNIKKIKRKNSNINKLYTDRTLNPFIKNQNNKNIQINNTYSNEKVKKAFKNLQNIKNITNNNINNKPHSLSKGRKKNNILYTNFKYTKPKLLKTFNIKRNISASNRITGHKKINNNFLTNNKNIKRENEDEFNINYNEENENLLFDIHTSYNLTTKNPFYFYYTDIQFRSSKNVLDNKNKKINFGIKEENENDDNNNSEFSFRKEKINNNNEDDYNDNNNNIELKSKYININEIKNRNKNEINKKDNTTSSLHKKRINVINIDSINKERISNNEIKGVFTPEIYEYSLEKKRNPNKQKNTNKYNILNNNGIIYNKNPNNNIDNENNKIIGKIYDDNLNIYEKRKKFLTKDNSLKNHSNNKNRNKIEIYKNKSPTITKYNNYTNYNFHNNNKLYFINSPNINISNLNRNKNESYDDTFKRKKKIKFHKIIQKEKNNSNYQSKSLSNSKPKKPKTRAKSNINKIENSNKYINRINKLIFIIKSNWGNIIKIGINRIKLLDKNNKIIPIKYANFDINKPYIAKYIKGETKQLIIGYDKNYYLKNIIILNGLNDTGVKYLTIENDRGKILWKGNIPRINVINAKKFFICIDNYNYNSNTIKKNILFSKTIFLNKNECNNLYNLKHIAKTLRINQQNDDNSDLLNRNYELCDRIKIKLINNYGNRDYIGLSGIDFYDNNNKLINILENKKNIRINENIVNPKEKRILYNLFNNKNDTINPKYMFLTTNCNAFIYIEFKQCVKISKIIIYNYNNNNYKNCATKGILLYFYYNKKSNKIKKPIYLYRPPGEENIDYGQIISYPFDNNIFYNKIIKENMIHLKLNDYKMIYNDEYQFYSPFLPFGYILKIEMINNYGNKNYIGIQNIQLFDEDDKEINLQFSSLNYNKYKFIDYSNDSYTNNDNIDLNNNGNDVSPIKPRIFILPEALRVNPTTRPLIFSKFHFFNDLNNDLGENRIYFIFNECIILSRICIHNYNKNLDIATKDIKILLDDNIIFEGELKNIDINNIFFCDNKNINIKKIKNTPSNNSTTLIKRLEKTYNGLDRNIEKKKKKINSNQNLIKNINNDERYTEHEGKNGTKILKLNQ